MTNDSKFQLSIDKLWFALLIAYIITGYFAQDVLLPSAISSACLYLFLAYSAVAVVLSGKIKLSAIFTWEMVCMSLAFVAMLYSTSFSVLSGTYYSLIVNFVLVFILTQMPWNEKRFNTVMSVYAFTSAALVIIIALTGNLKDESASGRLGQELMGNANILAMMLMVSAIYAIWMFISSKTRFVKSCFAISVAIIYTGMFLSGGRKYVVVPLIFAYIMLLNKTDKNQKKHMIKSTVLIFLIGFFALWLIMNVPVFYDAIGSRFEGALGLIDDSYEIDHSSLLRKEMADYGFKQWLKSPIWGYGLDSFKDYNALYGTGHKYYSHNNFIELLFNQGIIGFVAYYSFYVYLFVKAMKRKGDSLGKGFVFGIVISLLFFEYFGVTYSVTSVQFLLFFAFYNACSHNDKAPM